MNIAVLVLDGVFDLGLSSILDTFALANGLSGAEASYDLTVVGVREEVRTQHGLGVPVTQPTGIKPDLVLVPANGCTQPDTLSQLLRREDTQQAMALLRDWQAAGVEIAAACTGTYVLAHSGVLDAAPATTSWWLCADFRRRFPKVELDESQMVVSAPGIVTAGAALAHVDLALWIIRRMSPELASTTARYLLCNRRPSQAAYAIADQIAHDDPAVRAFERWCRDHLKSFSMPEAARAAGMSERTLQRHVKRVLGRSPIAYVQDLRVSHAIHRLQTSDDTIDAIAVEVGYREGSTLANLIRRKSGMGLKQLRGF